MINLVTLKILIVNQMKTLTMTPMKNLITILIAILTKKMTLRMKILMRILMILMKKLTFMCCHHRKVAL